MAVSVGECAVTACISEREGECVSILFVCGCTCVEQQRCARVL